MALLNVIQYFQKSRLFKRGFVGHSLVFKIFSLAKDSHIEIESVGMFKDILLLYSYLETYEM